jgi:hypothetical protein
MSVRMLISALVCVIAQIGLVELLLQRRLLRIEARTVRQQQEHINARLGLKGVNNCLLLAANVH